VVDAGCLLQRLGIEFDDRPDLARALLDARARLDRARGPSERAEARAVLGDLIGATGDDME
jgi:hypothetical protein